MTIYDYSYQFISRQRPAKFVTNFIMTLGYFFLSFALEKLNEKALSLTSKIVSIITFAK